MNLLYLFVLYSAYSIADVIICTRCGIKCSKIDRCVYQINSTKRLAFYLVQTTHLATMSRCIIRRCTAVQRLKQTSLAGLSLVAATGQSRGLSTSKTRWTDKTHAPLSTGNAPASQPCEPPPSSSSTELQPTDLLDVYKSLVARGLIQWDAEQVRCVMEVRATTKSV